MWPVFSRILIIKNLILELARIWEQLYCHIKNTGLNDCSYFGITKYCSQDPHIQLITFKSQRIDIYSESQSFLMHIIIESLLHSWNQYNIVCQLYFSKKQANKPVILFFYFWERKMWVEGPLSGELLLPPLFKWMLSNCYQLDCAIKTALKIGLAPYMTSSSWHQPQNGNYHAELKPSPKNQTIEYINIESNYKYYCISFPITVSEVKLLFSSLHSFVF